MSSIEEKTSASNSANNSFTININKDKPLPDYPIQYPYPTPQYPYPTPTNINTVNPTISPTISPVFHINSAPATTGFVCSYCGSNLAPIPIYAPGIASWISGTLLCFVFCPLFWLPCVSHTCMDEKDICRNCNRLQREKKVIN